jgi:hypothetical protein
MEKSPFRIFGLDTSFGFESDMSSGNCVIHNGVSVNRQGVQVNSSAPTGPRVSVRLGDLLPLLMEASKVNRAWIDDFSDDLIEVTQDLYEVALAYESMRRAA